MSADDDSRHTDYAAFAAANPRWFANEPGGITVVTDAAEMARIEAAMAAHYEARGLPADWARVGIRYEDPYLMLVRDAVVFPGGAPGVHHRVLRPGFEPSGVAVLPRLGDRIVLVRHFRHATRSWQWECPRGATDPGETTEQSAIREIAEEIEGEVAGLRLLGRIHGSTALMGMSVALAWAELTAVGKTQAAEGIAGIRLVTPAELDEMVVNGEITDAFTLGCILHARLAGLL
jgi:ADP-ribose pyrophosphatase